MLTPKEKAKELVYLFLTASHGTMEEYVPIPNIFAKQCALIAVDEILKSGCTLPSDNAYYGDNEEAIKYWLEVKSELEKL